MEIRPLMFQRVLWYTNFVSFYMSLTVKKLGPFSLALGIALVSILVSCHTMSQHEVKIMTDSATHQPISFIMMAQDASEEGCLLASHDMLVSFLASASERSNTLYLMGALAALFILWRLKGKDQDTNQRMSLARNKGSLVFHYLQEAFSRGILHPRIYESVGIS